MKNHNFLLCGSIGCCMEVFWTGLNACMHKDYRLKGASSIWMFPIYGLCALILPVSRFLKNRNCFVRGTLYMLGIFSTEYVSGRILKKHDLCPWDYSDAKLNIKGVIRLDYAPLWFLTGLFFERLLTRRNS